MLILIPRILNSTSTNLLVQFYMLQKKISGFILDLQQKLGKGAFGEVFLSIDTTTGEVVAVKQIPIQPKYVQRYEMTMKQFQNEIKIMRSLQNDNIVKFINVQKTTNNLYLVMEFCNQGTLDDYIKKKCAAEQHQIKGKKTSLQYLSEAEAKIFFKQILNGFKVLHANKIVHRDLKPQNILIHNGEAKIGDFGFSKIVESGMEDTLLKTYAGSPLYMSYQLLREQTYTYKCDIWSLGVIYYEILYGQPPWIASSIPDLITKIENYPVKFPERPVVSQETKQIIVRMLQAEEHKRISWEDLFKHPMFSDQMEIEEENNLRQTVSNIDNLFDNKLRRSHAKQKLYFENHEVIQNVKQAQKQQGKMQKIFNIPNNPNNPNPETPSRSTEASLIQRNKIFEPLKERSVSPKNMIMQKQQSDQANDKDISQQFLKNQQRIQNERIAHLVSEWVIHRRNKAVFLNTLSQKWFDLYENKVFTDVVSPGTYYRFIFVLTKYQTTIFFKMNRRLDYRQLDKYKKFTQQQWLTFVNSPEYQTSCQQVRHDFYIVKGFLSELIVEAKANMEQEYRTQPQMNNYTAKALAICNMDFVEKSVLDPIYFENVSHILLIIKEELKSQFLRLQSPNERSNFFQKQKALIQYATHLSYALRIKEVFKYNAKKPIDFFKYYQEVETEHPERQASLLGIV